MKGFDSRWKDFPDYIYGVTKEIWEDRNIARSITIMQMISTCFRPRPL